MRRKAEKTINKHFPKADQRPATSTGIYIRRGNRFKKISPCRAPDRIGVDWPKRPVVASTGSRENTGLSSSWYVRETNRHVIADRIGREQTAQLWRR
jgi:hypothetical protein